MRLQTLPTLRAPVVALTIGLCVAPNAQLSAQEGRGPEVQVLRTAIEHLVQDESATWAGFSNIAIRRNVLDAPVMDLPAERTPWSANTAHVRSPASSARLRSLLPPRVTVCDGPDSECTPEDPFILVTVSEPTVRGSDARVVVGMAWTNTAPGDGQRPHTSFWLLDLRKQGGHWVVTKRSLLAT